MALSHARTIAGSDVVLEMALAYARDRFGRLARQPSLLHGCPP
jgi:hypothetical protein